MSGNFYDRQPDKLSPPIESADDFALRMLGGATFGSGAKIILPSGKEIGGDEAQAFTSLYDDGSPAPEFNRGVSSEHGQTRLEAGDTSLKGDSPLSSKKDRWTGDPRTDRASLVARALDALIKRRK